MLGNAVHSFHYFVKINLCLIWGTQTWSQKPCLLSVSVSICEDMSAFFYQPKLSYQSMALDTLSACIWHLLSMKNPDHRPLTLGIHELFFLGSVMRAEQVCWCAPIIHICDEASLDYRVMLCLKTKLYQSIMEEPMKMTMSSKACTFTAALRLPMICCTIPSRLNLA